MAKNFKPLTGEEREVLEAHAGADRFDVIKGPALEYWKTR